jgi:DNA-binding FadR family transcriptional regulator
MSSDAAGPASDDADARPHVRRSITLSNRRPLKRSELIARELAQYIVDSRLSPGAMLPREHEMIEQLGVGRTTLREALRLLESRGIITIRSGPSGGPVVRQPQPSDLMEALTLILQFQRGTLREVHEARAWLEPVASRMATPLITKSELKRLQEVNDAMRAEIETGGTGIMDLNQQFHQVIAASCSNVVVQTFTETLLTVAESGVSELYNSDQLKRAVVDEHDEIIKALRSKDPDRAESVMRWHLEEATKRRLTENPGLMERPLRWIT